MTDRNAYWRAHQRQPRNRLGRLARRRAQEELIRRHQDEYRQLIEEQRAAQGLPPARPGRPGNGTV